MTEARAKPPLTPQKINNYVWAPSLQENISPAQRGNYQQFNKPNSEKRERERERDRGRRPSTTGHRLTAIRRRSSSSCPPHLRRRPLQPEQVYILSYKT